MEAGVSGFFFTNLMVYSTVLIMYRSNTAEISAVLIILVNLFKVWIKFLFPLIVGSTFLLCVTFFFHFSFSQHLAQRLHLHGKLHGVAPRA